MDFNTILMLVGTAVLILPVVYMLGYVRHEKQAKHTINAIKADNDLVNGITDAAWQGALTLERNVNRELQLALVQSSQAVEAETKAFNGMKDQWAYSNGYRKALVQAMLDFNLWDFGKHRDDPAAMIKLLREHAATLAVDPQLNKAAKNLHTRGVRKGAAMGRKQMANLMQKSIDNQAMTIQMLQTDLKSAQEDYDDACMRRNTWRQAVLNTLEDKIALPGVRKALKVAITTEYDRMKAVNRLLKD